MPLPAAMLSHQARLVAPVGGYRPRNPTESLLYRVVQEHFLPFLRDREAEGRYLPAYIKREFAAFMECGVLANGFMRLKCDECRKATPFVLE